MTANDQLVALRMPKDLVDKVDHIATDEGRSRSSMIRRMLDQYIDNYAYVKQ